MAAKRQDREDSMVDKPSHRARAILERFKTMKTEKQPWHRLYQYCGEYVMTRKQNFEGKRAQADILTDNIYDDTAPKANRRMAASLIGALWPNGAKSFRIEPPKEMLDEIGEETEEVKAYYEWVTRRMAEYIDNPKSGFQTALDEYMLDQGAFGISGIQVDDRDDYEVPLIYRARDAKVLHVLEGPNGFIDTVYMGTEFTLRQLVQEYGLDAISKKQREAFLTGKQSEKVTVLQAIEPRLDGDPTGFGVKNMPIASVHIEVESEKILRESGFLEMPIAVARFAKAMGEVYGRCPAMESLPSIFEANALGEAWTLAVEKTLDPSLLVLDDGSLGGGTIDTSPGAINVVSVSGRIGGSAKPVEPLFLVGDLNWTAARRTELTQVIQDHFYYNILFDVESDQRMTLGEFNGRNQWRGQTLNPIYSRQYAEVFVPIIEVSFNKLRRKGLLGVIPGSQDELNLLASGIIPKHIPEPVLKRMMTGEEVYKITFISPASRIMHSEELAGLEHLTTVVTQVAPVEQSILDIPDWDWIITRMQELDGAPREAIRSAEKIRNIREQKQQAQEQMMQMEAARQNSETARNMGQAAASVQEQGAAA